MSLSMTGVNSKIFKVPWKSKHSMILCFSSKIKYYASEKSHMMKKLLFGKIINRADGSTITASVFFSWISKGFTEEGSVLFQMGEMM